MRVGLRVFNSPPFPVTRWALSDGPNALREPKALCTRILRRLPCVSGRSGRWWGDCCCSGGVCFSCCSPTRSFAFRSFSLFLFTSFLRSSLNHLLFLHFFSLSFFYYFISSPLSQLVVASLHLLPFVLPILISSFRSVLLHRVIYITSSKYSFLLFFTYFLCALHFMSFSLPA